MSSLLTNNSAMVALQTMKTINKNMGDVQNEVSTGKRIANARDNAAIWGIATTMQTDVSGFKAISESLSLGTATLSVGRDAAETITGLLDQLKGKIVAAQEENVDRTKIQADVVALRDQITTVVAATQFNGLNLLQGNDQINILASLNRASDGQVTDSNISFRKQDLTTTAGVVDTSSTDLALGSVTGPATNGSNTATPQTMTAITAAGAGTLTVTVTGADGGSVSFQTAALSNSDTADTVRTTVLAAANDGGANQAALAAIGVTVGAGTLATDLDWTSSNAFDELTVSITDSTAGGAVATGTLAASVTDAVIGRRAETVGFSAHTAVAGNSFRVTLGSTNYDYVAGAGDTMNDVVTGLGTLINSDPNKSADVTIQVNTAVDPTADPTSIYVDNAAVGSLSIAVIEHAEGTVGGGLFGLQNINVTTGVGADAALIAIEGMIQHSINAAAHFGSAQGRIQTQTEFVSKVIDGLTSGVGALVDADMEAASARLQALQVQQQLGIQALSIANQQPQNILALFQG